VLNHVHYVVERLIGMTKTCKYCIDRALAVDIGELGEVYCRKCGRLLND